ncbi:hypothetical protein MN116_004178 [Schistosoma mekongi]|uniref:Uncharacterized protein n=1 Tax=Schistosoma mekongi TaxID=38744 RepID=A0AAE1ZFY1_SCHME|nr:hypothetical protein MN116_004178 [Schistosoma mekongi]
MKLLIILLLATFFFEHYLGQSIASNQNNQDGDMIANIQDVSQKPTNLNPESLSSFQPPDIPEINLQACRYCRDCRFCPRCRLCYRHSSQGYWLAMDFGLK